MLWRKLVRSSISLQFIALAASAYAALPAQGPMPAAMPEDLLPELKHLLDVGMRESPSMLVANLDLASAEGQRIVNRSALFPIVSANGQYAYTETAVSSNTSSRSKTNGPLYGISFYQPLFQWGTLKAQADIGKLQVHISEKSYVEAYRLLALSIRSQYLTLIQKKLKLRNQRFGVRVAESTLSVQEARLRDGRISAGDIVGFRLGVDEARIFADQALEDYDSTRKTLARIVGLDDIPDESIPLEVPKPTFAPETIGSYFEEMKRVGVENSVMLATFEDQIKASKLNYKIAKYRLFPKFNITGSFGQSNQTQVDTITRKPTLTAITTTQIGVGANWTIFDGLATRGAKMSALAARRLAEFKLKQFKESVSDTARQLERQISYSGRLMDLTQTRKELTAAAIEKVGNDVRSGVSSQNTLDIVTQNANNAELTAMGARADFLVKWSNYVSVLGVDPILKNLPSSNLRNGK